MTIFKNEPLRARIDIRRRCLPVVGALLATTALTNAALAQSNASAEVDSNNFWNMKGEITRAQHGELSVDGVVIGNRSSGYNGTTATYKIMSDGIVHVGDTSFSAVNIGQGKNEGIIEVWKGGLLSVDGDPIINVGYGGVGTLDIRGGTVTTGGDVRIGFPRTIGATGTLIVSDGGALNMGAGTTISVGGEGSKGTMIVNTGGTVSFAENNGEVTIGDQNTKLAELIIGGADAAEAAGTLDVPLVTFQENGGSLVFNHTDDDYVFGADVATDTLADVDSARIVISNGTTSLTGDYSGYDGLVEMTGGTLQVNTDLSGFDLDVVDGATLGGGGTLAGINVQSGGTLAPGNSVGTLSASSAVFQAGSTYEVEINDGGFEAGVNNDLTAVSGSVVINGGTVHVLAENGTDDGSTYTDGQYTILTAGGAVDGQFAEVTDDLAFLEFELSYDDQNVYLDSTVNFDEGGDGSGGSNGGGSSRTGNYQQVLDAVASLDTDNEVYEAVVNLTVDEADHAVNQLSGEAHASNQTALVNGNSHLSGVASARVRSAFGAVASDPLPVLAYDGTDAPELAPADTQYFSVWGQAFGAYFRQDGDGNAAATRQSTGGMFVGGDAALADNFRLGLVGGYARSGMSVGDRSSSADTNNYYIGAYGGAQTGDLGLRFGTSYGYHKVDSSRAVNVSTFSDSLSASYDAHSFQAFGEAGYKIDLGDVAFEPYAGLAHVRVKTDGFTEQGGAAALTVDSATINSTFTTLGVRGETEVALGAGTMATLSGGIGWRHAFGDITPENTMRFASGGDTFLISGTPIARNTLLLDLGADMPLSDSASLGIAYSGEFASGVQSHSVTATFGVNF